MTFELVVSEVLHDVRGTTVKFYDGYTSLKMADRSPKLQGLELFAEAFADGEKFSHLRPGMKYFVEIKPDMTDARHKAA